MQWQKETDLLDKSRLKLSKYCWNLSNNTLTNTKNSESVIVKINDRGPFVKNRIIDLSRSAFISIANLDAGVIDVTIEVIK